MGHLPVLHGRPRSQHTIARTKRIDFFRAGMDQRQHLVKPGKDRMALAVEVWVEIDFSAFRGEPSQGFHGHFHNGPRKAVRKLPHRNFSMAVKALSVLIHVRRVRVPVHDAQAKFGTAQKAVGVPNVINGPCIRTQVPAISLLHFHFILVFRRCLLQQIAGIAEGFGNLPKLNAQDVEFEMAIFRDVVQPAQREEILHHGAIADHRAGGLRIQDRVQPARCQPGKEMVPIRDP